MGEISDRFNFAFRDDLVPGVPAAGQHDPIKAEIRGIALPIEAGIAAAALSGTDLDAAMQLVAPLLTSAQAAQAASEASLVTLNAAVAAVGDQVAAQIDGAVADATASSLASSQQAQQAANTARVFVGGNLYPTTAAGLSATPADGYFSVPGGRPGDYAILYRKVSGNAVEQSRYGTKLISVDDFPNPQAAATYAEPLDADLFLPAGDFTGNVSDASDAVIEGNGRLFNTAGVMRSTYAEPRSRFVIGQEYLWSFHYAVANTPPGTNLKVVLSGDSTTFGAYGTGTLPDQYRMHNLIDAQFNRYGIYGPDTINSGRNGMQTREWVQPGDKLDQDIANYPNMAMYVIRLGLNDGSPGFHDIANFRTSIRTGLARLRAWKNVQNLSIVLMTPNSTSETGSRDEAWLEQVSRVLKKAARDFQCCFIDTYASFRDARNGAVNAWLDNQGAGGSGIHPDGIFNLWIADLFGRTVIAPLSVRSIATNTFINAPGVGTRAITASIGATSFVRGVSIFRTDPANTFPLDGIIIVTKSADGVTRQENVGFATSAEGPGKRTYTRYALDGNAWSDWRGRPYSLTLASGWSLFTTDNLQVNYRKSIDGSVSVNGRVKNAAATAGSSIGQLPAAYRPPVNMRFLVHNAAATTLGTIEVQTDGNIAWVSGDNTDVVINLSFQAAS